MSSDNTISDVFGGLWDRAVGVFDKVVDFEFTKLELEAARDIQLFKSAQAFEDAQRQAQFSAAAGNEIVGGISNQTLLTGAGLGIVGLFLLMR